MNESNNTMRPYSSETAQTILKYAKEYFGAEPQFLWDDENAVLRHGTDGKWFAVLLTVQRRRFDRSSDDLKMTEIIDLKCDHVMIGSLLKESGYYPAYHMNKEHWITVVLDGSVSAEDIIKLMTLSFNLTKKKPPKRRAAEN